MLTALTAVDVLRRDKRVRSPQSVSLLARHSRLVPNPPRPNLSLCVTTTQTSREKRTASSP